MKIGAENRKKLALAVGLMVVAMVVMLLSLGGSAPPPAARPATITTKVASLVAARSPAELGLIVLASPRALPEDLLRLPRIRSGEL